MGPVTSLRDCGLDNLIELPSKGFQAHMNFSSSFTRGDGIRFTVTAQQHSREKAKSDCCKMALCTMLMVNPEGVRLLHTSWQGGQGDIMAIRDLARALHQQYTVSSS